MIWLKFSNELDINYRLHLKALLIILIFHLVNIVSTTFSQKVYIKIRFVQIVGSFLDLTYHTRVVYGGWRACPQQHSKKTQHCYQASFNGTLLTIIW